MSLVGDRASALHAHAFVDGLDFRFIEFREGLGFTRARPHRFGVRRRPLEAAEAVVGVIDEARLAHLAVVDDIDAGCDLPGNGIGDRGIDQLVAAARVVGFASTDGAHDLHQLR